MSQSKLRSFLAHCGSTTARDRRNEMRYLITSMAWAICFMGGMFLIKFGLVPAGPVSWAVAALPSAAAVLLLKAYLRFLREADEFQRVIQLQALAIGFGGSFFAICGYSLFVPLGAPAVDGVTMLAVMPLFYIIGVLIGRRQYT